MELQQDTEDRILDAAKAAFGRRGTAGARMQEIADSAGVNKALLHYYFRSKEQLAAAVFQREASHLIPPVLQVLSSDLDLEEKVRRVIDLYLRTLRESPNLPGYVLAEMQFHPERLRGFVASVVGEDADRVSKQALSKLKRQIDSEVREGRMRAIDEEQFFLNLVSLCVFPFVARPMVRVLLGLDDKRFETFIDRRAETLADFFLGALRP